ncbi:MAG: Unknown protein [uncultured Aureispira sp.]|uniref:Uncharacterized protein n=1 Tax=uncultured Aureispira sp. TaxID=1331704 RepID=A0A6S6SF08_9BACT|nr:MAG: Unknown protein [uncultured Aureispira sp.]
MLCNKAIKTGTCHALRGYYSIAFEDLFNFLLGESLLILLIFARNAIL